MGYEVNDVHDLSSVGVNMGDKPVIVVLDLNGISGSKYELRQEDKTFNLRT